MKRMRVLFGQRRVMVLVTLTVLVLAAAALVASSASFSATSANPNNVFTAGSLNIGNYLADGSTINEGQAVVNLSMTNMKPGDSSWGVTVIKNTGTLPGTFTLTGSLKAGSDAALASQLQLVVKQDGTQIYSGSLSGFGPLPLTAGQWVKDEVHTYRFDVTFPAASGNSFMGASATAIFTWNAVQ